MKPERALLRVTVATAAVLLTAGCDRRSTQAMQICTDSLGRRVPDGQCLLPNRGGSGGGSSASYFRSYYLSSGSSVPAVGEQVSGGSFRPTPGVSYARGAVTRGGFGSRVGGWFRGG